MIDTAGIREAASNLEGRGLNQRVRRLRHADLRLWVLDGSGEPVLPDDDGGWFIVINKIDLPAAWDWSTLDCACACLRRRKRDWHDLCAAISRELVPAPPMPGEAVPCLAEHFDALAESDGFVRDPGAKPQAS